MKRKNKKESEKQTQDGIQILKIFNLKEIDQIQQLVKELHKIRKIEPPEVRHFWQKKKAIKEQIDMVNQQQFYYVGDFIISMGWLSDRKKIKTLWQYLQFEFRPK